MKYKLLFSLLLLVTLSGYSQSADSTGPEKTQVSPGIQYISDQTYAGRTDSIRLPVLIPEINVQFPKGFYLNSKGYLNMSGGTTTFDGISLEPGYALSRNNWNGSLSVIKNFISDSSNLIIAPVNASIEFYLNKQTRVITPFIGSEYVFASTGNDFILYGGLSKHIAFTKEDSKIMVEEEPSFSLTGGSQNFYYSFLKSFSSNGYAASRGTGRGRGRGSGTSGSPSTSLTQEVSQQSSQFGLLAWAIELPLTVSSKRFQWMLTPTLETPVNLINSGGPGTQSASSIFYVTTEILFRL